MPNSLIESALGGAPKDDKADTELVSLLKFATGVSYQDLITKGLLGGTRDASVMTGLPVSTLPWIA